MGILASGDPGSQVGKERDETTAHPARGRSKREILKRST